MIAVWVWWEISVMTQPSDSKENPNVLAKIYSITQQGPTLTATESVMGVKNWTASVCRYTSDSLFSSSKWSDNYIDIEIKYVA